MTTQQKCPICNGNGIVPGGFYTSCRGSMSISTVCTEPCRNCEGMGVVYVTQVDFGKEGA